MSVIRELRAILILVVVFFSVNRSPNTIIIIVFYSIVKVKLMFLLFTLLFTLLVLH